MKKLLTIALALVMVLALAAPAMATVGFGPEPEAAAGTPTEWSVKIRALEFVPATSGFTFENNYYPDYDPTKGIVAGSDIRFVVDVTFPVNDDITYADDFENTLKAMKLTVAGTNLAFGWYDTKTNTLKLYNATSRGHEYANGSLPRITTNSATKGVYYMQNNLVDYKTVDSMWDFSDSKLNTISYIFGQQNDMHLSDYYTTTYSFMFVADVLNTADVTVSATVSANGRSFTKVDTGIYEYRFVVGTKNYTVRYNANNDFYDIWNEKDARKVVRFTVDSKDQITNIAVANDAGTEYKYTTVEPLTYAEMKAAQDAVALKVNGTASAAVDKANAVKSLENLAKWATAQLKTTKTDASITDADKAILGVLFASATAAKWTAGTTLVSTVTDDIKKLPADDNADVVDYLTTEGLAGFMAADDNFVITATGTVMTPVDAWAEYIKEYNTANPTEKIVLVVPADQIASSITGEPLTGTNGVSYVNSMPFLGTVETNYAIDHSQWWDVNKDVKLAEIVFSLNDKVHSSGYAASVSEAIKRVDDIKDTLAHSADAKYPWCSTKVFTNTEIYAETVNLYDGRNVTASKGVNKTTYDELYPIFKEIMDILGFQWDGTTAYMYRAAFVEKFGGKLDTSASYTYAAYTSALVVADPNAQPPQTGDTTSVLGFVMIAVAVLAAGAVVVKKVRA